jgi:hypothetical protein
MREALKETLKKRKLCWIHPPSTFGLRCQKCEKDDQLEWSEYEQHTWCRRCKIDSFAPPDFWGIEAMKLIVGPDCFDKYSLRTGQIYEFGKVREKYDWRPTKRFGKLVRNPERDKFLKEKKNEPSS